MTATAQPQAHVDEFHIPESLKDLDIWVCWNQEIKQPLAPWLTHSLFPTPWGEGMVSDPECDYDERPEATYKQARIVSELSDRSPAELAYAYSKTPVERRESDDSQPPLAAPSDLIPTVILPHDPPDPPLMLIDLDDVRDPETGDITSEVDSILDQVDAYTAVSSSGTGLHIFARARLPPGTGRVIETLNQEGHIEMYDHGRVVGATWEHVAGTPTTVPSRQNAVDELISQYVTSADENASTGLTSSYNSGGGSPTPDSAAAKLTDSDSRSPYFDIDITAIADRGRFGTHRHDAPGGDWQGPHPAHGAKSGARWDSESTNFAVEPQQNVWHCFLHGTGGGPLELVAVLEDVLDCETADQLGQRPRAMARTCLHTRDVYAPDLADEPPPYAALVGIALEHDLPMEDSEQHILGQLTYKTALTMFDEMTPADLAE